MSDGEFSDDDLTEEDRRQIDEMAKIIGDVFEEHAARFGIPVPDLIEQLLAYCERRQLWGRHCCDEFEPPTDYRPEFNDDVDQDPQ